MVDDSSPGHRHRLPYPDPPGPQWRHDPSHKSKDSMARKTKATSNTSSSTISAPTTCSILSNVTTFKGANTTTPPPYSCTIRFSMLPMTSNNSTPSCTICSSMPPMANNNTAPSCTICSSMPPTTSNNLTSSCTICSSMPLMTSNNSAPSLSIPTPTFVIPSITSITSTSPVASAIIPKVGSAKGFFQNTGAVAGTFTAVGLVFLALFTFLATCLIRRRRRRQVIFNREAFAVATSRFEPVFLDDKHNITREGVIAHMHSDASIYGTYVRQSPTTTSTEGSVTTMEGNTYGFAGVGAGHRTGYDGAYSRQDQVSTDDVHVQSQQDVGHSASADPIPTSSMSTLYASDNASRLKQATRTSPDGQAHRGGHGYSQLLKAAGLVPGSRSSHSSLGAGSGGRQRGMSLSYGHKLYVFPDPYEELQVQRSSPAQVSAGAQSGQTAAAGMNDAYGGYVDENEHVH